MAVHARPMKDSQNITQTLVLLGTPTNGFLVDWVTDSMGWQLRGISKTVAFNFSPTKPDKRNLS